MNWMTIAWPMVAAACLTLGFIELRIGLTQPQRAARLLFAVSAFAVACISGLELALMRTHVLAEWWPLMRWLDIAVGVMLISLAAIEVQSFPSAPGEAAMLDAVWTVRRMKDETGRTTVREPVREKGFDAPAAAHSRAVARLSQDIAGAVRALAGS